MELPDWKPPAPGTQPTSPRKWGHGWYPDYQSSQAESQSQTHSAPPTVEAGAFSRGASRGPATYAVHRSQPGPQARMSASIASGAVYQAYTEQPTAQPADTHTSALSPGQGTSQPTPGLTFMSNEPSSGDPRHQTRNRPPNRSQDTGGSRPVRPRSDTDPGDPGGCDCDCCECLCEGGC
jgi:hypothetical protein